jgi:hypothetical protein
LVSVSKAVINTRADIIVDCMVSMCVVLWETAELFCKNVLIFCIVISNNSWVLSLKTLPALGVIHALQFFCHSNSWNYRVVSHFNLQFSKDMALNLSDAMKYQFRLHSFWIELFISTSLSCRSSLYILDKSPLSDTA